MSITLEIDEAHSLMCWTYPPGPQKIEHFQQLFAEMARDSERVHACQYLLIIYSRGVDISGFDAEAMERMQQNLKANQTALFGKDGIDKTAFVCPDMINKLAIEHFLAHSKGRLTGEFAVFDTREEAECWLGVRARGD